MQDSNGKIPLYWGITADGCLAFSDEAELLKAACGKSLASFPQGNYIYIYSDGEKQLGQSNNQVAKIPYFFPNFYSDGEKQLGQSNNQVAKIPYFFPNFFLDIFWVLFWPYFPIFSYPEQNNQISSVTIEVQIKLQIFEKCLFMDEI
uniref:DUF3700 domain-containing protein n=1 Tax=Picea sitchensis TaxID=3332 RepID=B8LKA1_PICSI|nr:unknown [Picea sitchensis]